MRFYTFPNRKAWGDNSQSTDAEWTGKCAVINRAVNEKLDEYGYKTELLKQIIYSIVCLTQINKEQHKHIQNNVPGAFMREQTQIFIMNTHTVLRMFVHHPPLNVGHSNTYWAPVFSTQQAMGEHVSSLTNDSQRDILQRAMRSYYKLYIIYKLGRV